MQENSYTFLQKSVAQDACPRADSYLNSPLYYSLTGRKGLSVYRHENSVLMVCTHPNKDNCLLVFPELGDSDFYLTATVLNMLEPPENGIQLARFSSEEVAKLKRALSLHNNSRLINVEIIDEDDLDWKYPVRILDTQMVSEMRGKSFKQVRTKFRKAAAHINIKEMTEDNCEKMMRAALKFWEGTMIINDKDTESMDEFYDAFIKTLKDNPRCAEGLFFFDGKRPVGFSVWERVSPQKANSFINICDTSITGLSDFQMGSTCRKLHETGIKYLNLGGSETESLDAFKRKYMPVESIQLVSAKVEYEQPVNSNIDVRTIIPAQKPCSGPTHSDRHHPII